MEITLADHQYGKAQTRVVRVVRGEGEPEGDPGRDRHDLIDLTVTTTLAGADLAATYLTGDNAAVLPTDSQKNAAYAFAARPGLAEIEPYALALARHFVTSQPAVTQARVTVERHGWHRLGPHSFQRDGGEVRTATAVVTGAGEWLISGLTGLVLLNTTGSEFVGFATDEYTTLPEDTDRVLATAVEARWRHATATATAAGASDWAGSYLGIRAALVAGFAETYSRSLQQTLYAMGQRVLTTCPEVVEIRLSLPNRHHLRSGVPDVFVATDRPYGLIEGTLVRAGGPAAGPAWW